MCENTKPIPPAVAEYAVELANEELSVCKAFFRTPRGDLRGKIVLKDGQAKFVCEGSEYDRAYAEQCELSVKMWTATILHLPDGGTSEVCRLPRYTGDREGMVPPEQGPMPGAERNCRLGAPKR
jgi:hypothetical protein